MAVIVEAVADRTGLQVEIVEAHGEGEKAIEAIVDLVDKGEVDFGAGLFSVTESRVAKVDYSRFLGEDTFTILMRTPKHFSKADSLIAPFSRDVWLAILASCIFMGPVLYVFIHRLDWRKSGEENLGLSLPRCYWFVYGALLKQGSTVDPKSGKKTSIKNFFLPPINDFL